MIAVGDIAECGSRGDDATAAITARLLKATPRARVLTLGDHAYPDGSARAFRQCYHPSWGRFTSRVRPVPGNHDYQTRDAAGYFAYFGKAAGPRGKGYYSFDLGAWHLVALNSNCDEVGGCGPKSPQGRWLAADLAAHRNTLHPGLLAPPPLQLRRARLRPRRGGVLVRAAGRPRRRRARRS